MMMYLEWKGQEAPYPPDRAQHNIKFGADLGSGLVVPSCISSLSLAHVSFLLTSAAFRIAMEFEQGVKMPLMAGMGGICWVGGKVTVVKFIQNMFLSEGTLVHGG